MKEIYEKTLKSYVRLLLVCVLAMAAGELIFDIFKVIVGDFAIGNFFGFLARKILLPFVLNIIIWTVTYNLIDSPNIEWKYKPLITFASLEAVSLVAVINHKDYPILWAAFSAAVMMSAIFGEKKYVRVALEIGFLCTLIAFGVKALFGDNADVDVPYYFIHLYVAIFLLVVSYFISLLILQFVMGNSAKIEEQLETQQNLTDRVKVDAMTGLINHTAFYSELDKMIRLSDKEGFPVSISVVDIDNFKSVNDTYGHANGDQVIIKLSEIMKEVCEGHIVCRYGGEEFSVIFKNCKKKEAVALMEQVLEQFRNTVFEWCPHPISFSCGVCQHYDIRVTAEDLFMQADKYLYRAKRNGKNQIVCE